MSPQQLEEEAAALAADIAPYFTSVAPVEAIWSAQRIAFLAERRNIVFGNKLFFDELLSLASVDTALYPPRDSNQLLALLKAVFAATTLDYLKQLSLVYYLLLDLDAYPQQTKAAEDAATNATERFADTYVVLPQFTDAMQGYWLLDNDQYDQAVPLLAVADFIPKIIRTLFLPTPSPGSSSRSDVARAKLLLRFLRTSNQPTSSAPGSEAFLQELEMRIQALCFVSGPTRALFEARTLTTTIQSDEQRITLRARLIFAILEHCFAPPRAAAIQNLLACSLDPEEEVTLESFVLSPPQAMTASWSYVAADVLIVRYISQARYMDAVGLDRRLGVDVSHGHTGGGGKANKVERGRMMEQRKRMIAGAREILPEVQKELLRIEESVEISGGAEDKTCEASDGVGVNGKSVVGQLADRPGLQLTPLSASPATRRSNTQTPTTQAAILSAVVRASASPSPFSTPGKRATTASPARNIGFLATNDADADDDNNNIENDDDAMQDEMTDMDGSTVLVSRPTVEAAHPAPASPWRNQPSLTSSSPFSGLPKLSRPAASPFRASGSPASAAFPPATTSPFSSLSLSSTTNGNSNGNRGKMLPGALGIVAQQGRRSRLARQEQVQQQEEADESADEAEAQEEDEEEGYGDDTFTLTQSQTEATKRAKGEEGISIGRLVPGRRGWKEVQEEEPDAEVGMEEFVPPPSKRRTRNNANGAKMTRPHTGVDLGEQQAKGKGMGKDKGKGQGGMSKSRTETNLAKRTTRSTSAANRKPLTLDILEQHQRIGEREGEGEVPIARRTRAATAEQESVKSTIYSVSEVGDAERGGGRSPTKSGGGRASKAPAKTASAAAVRRSNRLTSVEPEPAASPAKRRTNTTTRKIKMPGSLE